MLALMLLAGLTRLVPARWNFGDPKSLELRYLDPALLQAARQQHIAMSGVIHSGSDSLKQAREAARLKPDGVVLEGEFDSPSVAAFPTVPSTSSRP